MAKNSSRRNFLRAAPMAAALSLPLSEQLLFAANQAQPTAPETSAGTSAETSKEPFQLITAQDLAEKIKGFQTAPGDHPIYQPKSIPMTIAITVLEKKIAKDFEYHEGRDHIFLILDGAATFDLGGTPKEPHSPRPGEWLAPDSVGATAVEVKKGDMLLVPRGTPHRQSTSHGVQWMLISTTGSTKS